MIDPDHLRNFSLRLTTILEKEMAAGNPIVETSAGWPEGKTVMVFLGQPFVHIHETPGVEYRELNDPHWWKSEYLDPVTKHVLACKWGEERR